MAMPSGPDNVQMLNWPPCYCCCWTVLTCSCLSFFASQLGPQSVCSRSSKVPVRSGSGGDKFMADSVTSVCVRVYCSLWTSHNPGNQIPAANIWRNTSHTEHEKVATDVVVSWRKPLDANAITTGMTLEGSLEGSVVLLVWQSRKIVTKLWKKYYQIVSYCVIKENNK